MDLETIRKKRQAEADRQKAANAEARRQAEQTSLRREAASQSAKSQESSQKVQNAINQNTEAISAQLKDTTGNIADILSSKDAQMGESLNNLLVATLMARDPQLIQVVKDFTLLLDNLATANNKLSNSPINELPLINKQLIAVLKDFNKQESQEPDYTNKFDALEKALKSIDFKPVINIPKSASAGAVDLKPLQAGLDSIKKAVEANKPEFPDLNFEEVIAGLEAVKNTIAGLSFPVPNYVLPFIDSSGKATQSPVPFLAKAYDYVGATYPDAVTETYTFKQGGSGGTTVQTITVVYTDSTKASLSSVTRT